MSSKATSAPNEHRVSGELNCRDNDDDDDNDNGGGGVIDNRCKTVSGGTVGADCVFPFNYQVRLIFSRENCNPAFFFFKFRPPWPQRLLEAIV